MNDYIAIQMQPSIDKQTQCLNCGAELQGKFCTECGQSASVSRITLKETIEHFFSSSFSIEGPFRKTVTELIKNPGIVLRSYISGHRKTYYKPVAFFIVCTALYILIRAIIGYDPLEGQLKPLDETGEQEIANNMKLAARFMVANINNILFVLVIAIAAMYKLLYWKKYNFAEYLAVGFFITGIYILVGIINMLFSNYSGIQTNQAQLVFFVIYSFYVSISFMQSKKLGAILKYLLISVFSLILYMILGYGLSYLIVAYF